MYKLLIEIIGWYGVGAVLTAYALTSFSVITNESLWFFILNMTGALSLAYVSYQKKNQQTVVLNLVWAAIAVLGLMSGL